MKRAKCYAEGGEVKSDKDDDSSGGFNFQAGGGGDREGLGGYARVGYSKQISPDTSIEAYGKLTGGISRDGRINRGPVEGGVQIVKRFADGGMIGAVMDRNYGKKFP